jgi:TetR/AcrR family transcriptional repressor of nem operon
MSSREKILDVSLDLFYRNGYQATSVDEIIAQAKVSKSNFYYHFKSKEDLGLEVLNQRRASMMRSLDCMLGDCDECPRERLDRFVDHLVATQEAEIKNGGCPFGNLVAEMADHSERFRCYLVDVFGGLMTRIAAVIEAGQQQGAFRADICPHDVSVLFVQATQGMLLMTKCQKSVESLARGARLLVVLISTERERRNQG